MLCLLLQRLQGKNRHKPNQHHRTDALLLLVSFGCARTWQQRPYDFDHAASNRVAVTTPRTIAC